MNSLLDMPWRVTNDVRRRIMLPLIRMGFAWHGVRWGRGWRIFGMPIIQRHRRSQIILGAGTELRSWRSSNPLTPWHPVVLATRRAEAIIRIGTGCGLTGATLVAAECIEIGDRVLVGANAVITDTDFHPLTAAERARDILAGAHRPVVIEDDVFIGMQSLILKGVRIGRGSVVGAGAVVSRDVPPGVIVAGNPARIVRTLEAPPVPQG